MIEILLAIDILVGVPVLIFFLELLRRDKNNKSGSFKEGFINFLKAEDNLTKKEIEK